MTMTASQDNSQTSNQKSADFARNPLTSVNLRQPTSVNQKHSKIRVMVNRTMRGKMPKTATQSDWYRYGMGFKTEQTTAYGLAKAVYSGFAFHPIFSTLPRSKNSFQSAWHIALDFDTADTQSALDTLAQHNYSVFASFGYSTPSSKSDAPKSRLVFIFEEAITDRLRYEKLYRALQWQYPFADRSAKDAARLFYGSHQCDVWANWSIFPVSVINYLLEIYAEYEEEKRPKSYPRILIKSNGGRYGAYIRKVIENSCKRVQTAKEGGAISRHNMIYSSAANLASFVAASWNDLDEITAFNAILAAAQASEAASKYSLEEMERVIRDGMERGKANPADEPQVTMPDFRDI